MTGFDFQRLNFFKGLATSAEDWQRAHGYHIERQKLHNRSLHTSGIVPGVLENLMVQLGNPGVVEVRSGHAIDAQGNDLLVPEPREIRIQSRDYEGARHVHVVLRYREEPNRDSMRKNEFNGESYSGYAFVREEPELLWTKSEPDEDMVVLARIPVEGGRLGVPDRSVVRWARSRGTIGLEVVRDNVSETLHDKGWRRFPLVPERADRAAQGLLFASVVPKSNGFLRWRLSASRNEDSVLPYLEVENPDSSEIEFTYSIYRLDLLALVAAERR